MKLLLFCLLLAGCSGSCTQHEASIEVLGPRARCSGDGQVCHRDGVIHFCVHTHDITPEAMCAPVASPTVESSK